MPSVKYYLKKECNYLCYINSYENMHYKQQKITHFNLLINSQKDSNIIIIIYTIIIYYFYRLSNNHKS